MIKDIQAREILDSRGNPTVETSLTLSDGSIVTSSIPSGASTSIFESYELRDGDQSRYQGKGVLKACTVVNDVLSKIVIGRDPTDQMKIDQEMIALDGTSNKSKLGGNSILSVSQAVCKAGALATKMRLWQYIMEICRNMGLQREPPANNSDLPTPTFNIINGGKHGAGNLDFQEYHVVPATNKPFSEALEMGQTVYEKLKEILISKNAIHSVGDEGGFAPLLPSNTDGLELLIESISKTTFKINEDIFLGLDLASSSFYKNGAYILKDDHQSLSPPEMTKFLKGIVDKYHVLFIEDPLFEDDWEGWSSLLQEIGNSVMIVGDDFIATNLERLKHAIETKAANTILIKPNQAGTITETINVGRSARLANWKLMVSHRSGETNDSFIADLAVGMGSQYVKFGAPVRGERVAKYNRLLEIESELNVTK